MPQTAYDALPRLRRLAADLAAFAAAVRDGSRWKEPAVFFFDSRRQEAWEESRMSRPPRDPFAGLAGRIAAEMPGLLASAGLRHVARAVDGLAAAAAALAPHHPAARDFAALLAVPDDEVVTVLHPDLRIGFQLEVRGVVDIGQFHVLFADVVEGVLPGWQVSRELVRYYRDAGPPAAAPPLVAESRLQLYTPSALKADGTLLDGFGGCDYWLWPETPLARAPRIDGERVLLLGSPAYHSTWEATRRFPALAADLRLLEVLSPFRVAEMLSLLTGARVPVTLPDERTTPRAKAA
jgi:hypothetical protein